MRTSRFLAALCLLHLAACATPEFGRTTADNHGDPRGGCAVPPVTPGLELESRPAEAVFRISNRTRRTIEFYYDQQSGFGDYQMFFIRFRDRAGTLLDAESGACGWRTPKEVISEAYPAGSYPRHRDGRLTIPARGFVTVRRDLAALAAPLQSFSPPAVAPCEMQVRLYGYLDPGSRRVAGAVSEWQPAACPPVVAR